MEIQIDFISDAACSWSYVSLKNLEKAIVETHLENKVQIHLHPFELFPIISPEGLER